MTGHEAAAERYDEMRSFLDGFDLPDWVYRDADALLDERDALAAALERQQRETERLREALSGLDEPATWLERHYPAALEAMPTDLWRRFADAAAALAGQQASGETT